MQKNRANRTLSILGGILWIGCLLLVFLSKNFAYGADYESRPVLLFVGLLIGMSVVYLFAIKAALGAADQKAVWKTILLFAIAMRVITIISVPILEIDYYRYLWDGETVLAKVSPYHYSPMQVLNVSTEDPTASAELKKLAQRRDDIPRNATILSRIHFAQLPSIYPPVSQAVFAASALTTPKTASVEKAIQILKVWIVAFDIGVLLLLYSLLKHLNLPAGWAVGYAWCPLVLKEFANSCHLDAIAVFFSLWAVVLLCKAIFPSHQFKTGKRATPNSCRLYASAIVLALAIGSKLYPVVLVPLFVFLVLKKTNLKTTALFLLILISTTTLVCWPQLGSSFTQKKETVQENFERDSKIAPQEQPSKPQLLHQEFPPAPPMELTSSGKDFSTKTGSVLPSPLQSKDSFLPPSPLQYQQVQHQQETVQQARHSDQKSLKVFLSQWQMNDLLFALIQANLQPDPSKWYTFVPRSFRTSVVESIHEKTELSVAQVPFMATRIFLSVLFFVLALLWAWRAAHATQPTEWLHAVFLTLAWFWILLPTLNPWYWIWALPFIPFSKQKSWFLIAACVMLYYTRFWFDYQFNGQSVWGTSFEGEMFFHEVVVWCEHLPWMILLVYEFFFRKPFDLYNASQKEQT